MFELRPELVVSVRSPNKVGSRSLLEQLSKSSNKVVAKEAHDSLAAMAGLISRSY